MILARQVVVSSTTSTTAATSTTGIARVPTAGAAARRPHYRYDVALGALEGRRRAAGQPDPAWRSSGVLFGCPEPGRGA